MAAVYNIKRLTVTQERIYRRVRLGNLLSEEPPLPMVIIKNLRKQQKSLIRMAGYGLVTSAELMRMATSRCLAEVKKCLKCLENLFHQEKWKLLFLTTLRWKRSKSLVSVIK